MFFKIGVLKNFVIFTGEHLRWSPLLWAEILKNSFFNRKTLVTAYETNLATNTHLERETRKYIKRNVSESVTRTLIRFDPC